MEINNFPWREGGGAVLAGLLLKMLWDAVYRKIPQGFRTVRKLFETQAENAAERHDEHIAKLNALEDAIKHLQRTKCKNGRIHKRPTKQPKKPPKK